MSLFGAKPAGGGLFGSAAASAQQPTTRQRETLNTILLEGHTLVRSLTCPELYGDDRDQILAKLNQIAAALGVGYWFFKDGQSVIYTIEGPFHRFKSISYNMISEFTEARFVMDKYLKERYIKDPPAGFDDGLWYQACRENPDPDHLLPFPIRGFEQLLSRQKTQNKETDIANKVVDNLIVRLRTLESQGELTSVKVSQQKVVQKQLAHRLLRILSMQLIQQRISHPIESTEENIQAALEILSERLVELTAAVQDETSELRTKIESSRQISLPESDVQQLQKYLTSCQDGLESLSNIVRDNISQLNRISSSME